MATTIATKQLGNDKYELVKLGRQYQTYCNGLAVSKVYKNLSKELREFFNV